MEATEALRLSELRHLTASGEAAALRQRSRLSLPEVAADCGVTYWTIKRWESGERIPRGEAALRYADLLAALAQAETRRAVIA
jgi:DNA-binding transcriptional regulator YiaG